MYWSLVVIGENPEEQLRPFNEAFEGVGKRESKYDFYRPINRLGWLQLLDGTSSHSAKFGDVDWETMRSGGKKFIAYAMLKDGHWYENKRQPENPYWREQWAALFDDLMVLRPNDRVTVFDCHS